MTAYNVKGSVTNEITYTGAIYDSSTGLYYMNARYYDSEIGRFISQDTYRGENNDAGTWHLYTYCANDPINYVDPSGHWFKEIYISNKKLNKFLRIYMAAYQTAPVWVAAHTYFVCSKIANLVGRFTQWIGTVTCGVIGSLAGFGIGYFCGWSFATAAANALRRGKGIRIKWGFSVE